MIKSFFDFFFKKTFPRNTGSLQLKIGSKIFETALNSNEENQQF